MNRDPITYRREMLRAALSWNNLWAGAGFALTVVTIIFLRGMLP